MEEQLIRIKQIHLIKEHLPLRWVFLALAFCLWNSNIAFPSLLEQEFTADPELATPPKDSITWHFFIHTEELVRN